MVKLRRKFGGIGLGRQCSTSSGCDEISIINVTTVMKNDFGFLEVMHFGWSRLSNIGALEILMDCQWIDDLVVELSWKDLSMGYGRGKKWNLKYWNIYYNCRWWNFAWIRSNSNYSWPTKFLVVRFNDYMFIGNSVTINFKIYILENYGYGVDLALLRQWITLCWQMGALTLIRLYCIYEKYSVLMNN